MTPTRDGALVGSATSALATLASEAPLLGHALAHHVTRRGRPVSYHDKPYLVELAVAAEREPELAVRKAVQVGLTELLIQLLLHEAGRRGRIVAYVLPTYALRDRCVKNRVNPLLARVPAYRAMLPRGLAPDGYDEDGNELPPDGRRGAADTGSLRAKQVGRGLVLFLGANTEGDFVEFSADTMVIDELDRCDPSNLALARDRLREGQAPRFVRVGTPTSAGVGIARAYAEGDGRRYHHRCGRCGHRQALDWEAHVVARDDAGAWVPRDRERAGGGGPLRPVCARCERPFDRDGEGAGWVAERPSATTRSYHVSRLDVLGEDLRALVAEWTRAQRLGGVLVEVFHRSVLGLEHDRGGTSLAQADLDRCRGAHALDAVGGPAYAGDAVVAGVDVGSVLHVEVAVPRRDGAREVRWVGTVPTFEALDDVLRRYRARVCVVDAMPELHEAAKLRDRWAAIGSCHVWLAQFHRGERVGAEAYAMEVRDGAVVQVDRTQLLDATADDLRADPPRVVLPEDVFAVDGWSAQMRAPRRVLDADKGRFVWDEGSAPDHYRLADAYCRVAADLYQRGGVYLVL